jgi:alpha-tubulin suppressor-like RCC1 family protein
MPVGAQTGVKAIAAGDAHSVVLKRDGSVIAWGANGSGQATVPLEARSQIIAISAGSEHTVALKRDGSVIAWGDDRVGQRAVPDEAASGGVIKSG